MKPIPEDATGKALRLIAKNGSDLTKPLEMDFFTDLARLGTRKKNRRLSA
jgi:hypothetical protein